MSTPRIHLVTRRDALRLTGAGALLVLGCNPSRTTDPGPPARTASDGPRGPAPPPATSASPASSSLPPAPTSACTETHDNIEGPYYRAGAPERWDLTEAGMAGTVLDLEGRITAIDCAAGLRDVEMDVWQANAAGHYDNDGSRDATSRYVLRGRLRTDADGRYHLRTVVPGRYLNGAQYRPSHVHVKLRAQGFHDLTTQLYFPGDPFNDVDPFIHRSLIMAIDRASTGLRGRFDFVLGRV